MPAACLLTGKRISLAGISGRMTVTDRTGSETYASRFTDASSLQPGLSWLHCWPAE
jgi:hypothetical protein